MKRFSTWMLAALLGATGLLYATGNGPTFAQGKNNKACCSDCCCCKGGGHEEGAMCKHEKK